MVKYAINNKIDIKGYIFKYECYIKEDNIE